MPDTCWDLPGRSPAVAGMFYPGEPPVIEQTLDQWCAESEMERQAWRAALIPHAGWVYSGRIAAAVLNRITMPRTIIVFCPKHRASGVECAIAPWQSWLFPGGSMQTDIALSCRLADNVPELELDDRPHVSEHAIEVQLPLFARLAPDSQLVGITIGNIDRAQCQAIATGLAEQLRDQIQEVLLVVSSDMNHFANDVENRRLDALAMEALDQLDPQLLYDTCLQHRISMCGLFPAYIVLTTLQQLGALHRAVRVDYTTSADTSGDPRRVVGYAGMLFD